MTVDSINKAMSAAAKSNKLNGVLDVNSKPLVSSDFNHNPASSNFDLTQTQVIDGKFGRVLSWYDNEWGFSNRMCDTAVAMKDLDRMLNVKALKTFDQKNKTVLIRFDLNIPLNKEASTISDRITRIKNPIQNLLNKNNKVVILSHLGRPKGKRNDELSLNQIISSLENVLQKKIIFLSNCIGDEIEKNKFFKPDSIILLENCRFHEGEEQNDKFFASELSKLADVYINDAFACSHRAHASIEAITNFIPSYCGELLHEEILNLNDVVNNPKTPALTIIGGSKISTKITVIKNLLQKMDSIVIAGGMANNFLKYLGNDVKIH